MSAAVTADVLIACRDGLTGFPQATWPYTVVQTCLVQLNPGLDAVRVYTDRKAVAAALLVEALTGRFSAHHGFLAKVHLDVIDSYTVRIAELADRIETYFVPDRPAPAAGSACTGRGNC